MKVYFTKNFKKSYKKRIISNKKLLKRFDERYDLFEENPSNEVLNDHALTGNLKGYRAFSVAGNVRVIYYIKDDIAYFADIGTHNQVYK